MKRCQMCGSGMRLDAELVEGQKQYFWYKCTSMKCGAIFLVQKRIDSTETAILPGESVDAASIKAAAV